MIYKLYHDIQDNQDSIFAHASQFGQCPVKLFNEPHIKRMKKTQFFGDDTKNLQQKELERLIKEKEILEKNCERLRRNKEAELEKIKKEVLPKNDEMKKEIEHIKSSIVVKESNFLNEKKEIIEEHKNLKQKFSIYDEEKTKVLCKWAKSAKETFNKQLLEMFPQLKKDVLYIQGLERKHEEYQLKTYKRMNEIEAMQSQIEEYEKNKIRDKQELIKLQGLVRRLPYNIQMLIRKEFMIKPKQKYNSNNNTEFVRFDNGDNINNINSNHNYTANLAINNSKWKTNDIN